MSENIHRKKLFGGRETAEEIHWKSFGSRSKCLCGGPPIIQIRTFASFIDLNQRSPAFLMQLAARNEGRIPIVDFKGPDGTPRKFVLVSRVFACSNCRGEAERAAAKCPSWMVVEIDRGPGPDKAVSQVPS